MKICENCGKEHDGSYRSGRFCSKHCRLSFSAKHTKHKKCNFNINKIDNGRSKYGTWKCQKCNLIFETRAKRRIHNKEVHNNEIWNKGLTKKTSLSIKRRIDTFEQHIFDGTYIPHRIKHSKETREKISKTRSIQCNEAGSGGFKDVKWIKVKNIKGQEFSVRGHWEEKVALRLNDLGILWVKAKALKYFDGEINRHYIPDFWLPDFQSYIEVKGYYSDDNIQKMKFVLQQYQNIKIYFLYSIDYFDFVNCKTILNENLIMNLNVSKFWHR